VRLPEANNRAFRTYWHWIYTGIVRLDTTGINPDTEGHLRYFEL